MNAVSPPKFVCIDSSVLNKMAKDWDGSTHPPIDTELMKRGWILLISANHIFEMAAHQDKALVTKRLRFIRSFGIIAWLNPLGDDNEFLGMPFELLIREISTVNENKELSAIQVRDIVKANPDLISFGTGTEALKLIDVDEEGWEDLLTHVRNSQQEARERFSLVQMKVVKDSRIDRSDSLKGRFRGNEEREKYYKKFAATLTEELERRGDKKLSDYAKLAKDFVTRMIDPNVSPDEYDNSVLNYLSKSYELPIEKIIELDKLKRVGGYFIFFSWLGHALPDSSKENRLQIQEDSVPCWIVHRALDRHRQNEGAVQGSTEYDENFLWLGMYSDLTFVDKQTKDNCRRASQKDDLFRSLICTIDRANDESGVLAVLDAKDNN